MPKRNKSKAHRKPIYLDFAASYEPNPSSIHALGVLAKKSLERARMQVAEFIGARKEEIIFTNSGTMANNLAIQGLILSLIERGEIGKIPHVVSTNVEHASVLETIRGLTERKIITSTIVPVEPNGIVDPIKIKSAIHENTVLVSVMYANNEIGTIQPIIEIAKIVRHANKVIGRKNIFFHVDAVQAIHYLPIVVEKLGVDLLTISGTKVALSRGVGVLYKNKNVQLAKVVYGGDQEFGLWPGTENVPLIQKFGNALSVINKNKNKELVHLLKLRDYFFKKIKSGKIFKECGVLINGDLVNRLPNNVHITVPKIPSDLLVLELSACGIMVSAKSACKSKNEEGSHVLSAILPDLPADIGGLRFTLGSGTSKKEVDYTLKTLSDILLKLKKWYYN